MRLAIEIDQYIKTLRADHLAETAALKEENAAFKAVSIALQARIKELEWVQNEIHILRSKLRELEKEE